MVITNKGLLFLLPSDVRIKSVISSDRNLRRLIELKAMAIMYNSTEQDINWFSYKIKQRLDTLIRKYGSN